jgi:hypothetical protein
MLGTENDREIQDDAGRGRKPKPECCIASGTVRIEFA